MKFINILQYEDINNKKLQFMSDNLKLQNDKRLTTKKINQVILSLFKSRVFNLLRLSIEFKETSVKCCASQILTV